MARNHALDALRAFAMLLGVVWHVAIVFGAHAAPAPGVADEALGFLISTSHAFRMPLFFLIAGLFAGLLYSRRGEAGFIRVRALRIGVPFGVALITLAPLATLGEAYVNGKPLLGQPVGHYFAVRHLWFLEFLLLYYALALGVGRMVAGRPGARALAERIVDAGVVSRLRLVFLVVSSTVVLSLAGGWPAHDQWGLMPDVAQFLTYLVFFGFGWLLWIRREHLAAMSRHPLAHLCLALVASGVFLWMSLQGWRSGSPWSAETLAYDATGMLVAWTWLLALFGVFTRIFEAERRGLRYLTDSMYWVYLVHFPLIDVTAHLVARTHAPWPVQAAAVCALLLGFCLVTYELFVRYGAIGRVLHGARERPPREHVMQPRVNARLRIR